MVAFHRLVYSNSRRGNYTKCFRYAWFDFQGLRPKNTPIYFITGGIFHNILEDVYSLDGTLNRGHLSDFYAARVKEEKVNIANETMELDEVNDRHAAVEILYDVLHANYDVLKYQRDRYEFLALEIPIRLSLWRRGKKYYLRYIPLESPEKPMNEYVLVLDGLAHDRQVGRDVVFEHKTTGDQLAGYEAGLKWNFQSIGNILGGRLFLDHHNRPGLTTIVYNVFRKKAPRKPKPLQCKKCKGKKEVKGEPCQLCDATGVGGISLNSGETTPHLIDQFIDEHPFLLDTLWYEEEFKTVKSKLLQRSHPYHMAIEKVLMGHKASAFVKDAYAVFRDMRRRSRDEEAWFRNLSRDCKKCPYRFVCFEDSAAMRRSYYDKVTEDSEYPYEFTLHKSNFINGGFCNV